jgi:HEAT repeat protein
MDEMTSELKETISQCVARLRDTVGRQRQQAAAELIQLGIRTRGTILPRGSEKSPAPNRLPEYGMQEQILNGLKDADAATRREIALALGEWGDERAAQNLARLLHEQRDEDEDVRLACIFALKMIGGEDSVNALARTAAGDTSDGIRFAALAALEELGAGGWIDVTDRNPPPLPQRTEIRTRGGERYAANSEAIEILKDISNDDTQPEYLQQKAKDALAYLRR